MGKGVKRKNLKGGDRLLAGLFLSDQIEKNDFVQDAGPSQKKSKRKRFVGDIEFVDEKLSRKILEQAREQQQELENSNSNDEFDSVPGYGEGNKSKITLTDARVRKSSESESDDDAHTNIAAESQYYEHIEVDENDAEILRGLMSSEPSKRRTLADIIQAKLDETRTEIQSQMSDNASVQMEKLDGRVVEMYRDVGRVLAKYRAGKLPKAFKIVPVLANWEQILYIMQPDGWSAASVLQATRIFASNMNSRKAQRFYNLVLLPRVRDDIAEYQKLNFHLYMALKKALFKPAAFFKGLLLPLCEAGDCTLREAVIISSVMARNSIPMLHSAAALLKLAEMPYNGACSVFMKSLLDKRYALPYRVVDAMVGHFMRFTNDARKLPVLWHANFLSFVEHYKNDISSDQRDALLEVLRNQYHEKIGLSIRRELLTCKPRDEASERDTEPPEQFMDFDFS